MTHNKRITTPSKPTPKSGAVYGKRVCRAWHSTSQVQVLTPGVRKAEG